eukprot:4179182-Amphidinium_carterae.1
MLRGWNVIVTVILPTSLQTITKLSPDRWAFSMVVLVWIGTLESLCRPGGGKHAVLGGIAEQMRAPETSFEGLVCSRKQ